MSRLIVKNLPAYLTQDRLRKYFEASDGPGGTLTDVKLVLKPDGTSRRFGFIGYKSPQEAQRAQKWFNRSFVDSSRIAVDIGVKDAPAPRPNKRPRLGPLPSEAEVDAKSPVKGQTSKSSADKKTARSELQDEFMQVMKPRTKKGPSWKDDDPVPGPSTDPPAAATKKAKKSKKVSQEQEAEANESAHEQEASVEAISDLDWLKKHTKSTLDTSEVEKAYEQSEDESIDDLDANEDPNSEPEQDATKATILQTSRLFIRNLAFTCTEAELLELFQTHGEVSQVHLVLDINTKQPKGLAYVTFTKPEAALSAYEALDKTSFQGRLMHILPAVDRKGKNEEEGGGKKRTLKQDREVKRKAMAGKEFNWAMLYMNSDAVVSSIADRMNVSKADILNPESENAAVKLALAETHVIQETKTFLEQHGVDLSSLDTSGARRPPRSDRIILVKNIPYGTSAADVRALFEPHGELRRVLVPPAGTLAVVEFAHADEGRKAFRAVAYRRVGNSVVYLEKGPEGMFLTDEPIADASEPVTASGVAPIAAPDAAIPDSTGAGADEPALSAGTTLFVKNLAFSTTTEKLAQITRHLPEFAFARVQMRADPARPGARLSMGYGFVGFKNADGARRGLRSLDGLVLDGHKLAVKFAGRGAEEGEGEKDAEKAKARTTKMIVKNVPFEATKKDIRELFGAHAQLKSVRLPRKFDHRTRGFAFLEFTTRHEAERAYSALRHTHFLGRHLVLEWAEEGVADVEALRARAGVSFGGGAEMPGRKRKLEMGDGEGDGEDE